VFDKESPETQRRALELITSRYALAFGEGNKWKATHIAEELHDNIMHLLERYMERRLGNDATTN